MDIRRGLIRVWIVLSIAYLAIPALFVIAAIL